MFLKFLYLPRTKCTPKAIACRDWLKSERERRFRDTTLVHRPISSLWNRLAFVGLDGGEAFWGEGPDSPWWSR
jgi:hypothetical protein